MATSFYIDRMKSAIGLAAAAHTATTEVDSGYLDRKGFNTLFVLVNAGISTGNTLTLKLYDGATTSPATAVTLTGTPTVVDCTGATLTMYQFDLSGVNRYLKVSITASTSTSVTYAIDFLLADAANDPATGTAVTPLAKA
jgi:hypothetical protein